MPGTHSLKLARVGMCGLFVLGAACMGSVDGSGKSGMNGQQPPGTRPPGTGPGPGSMMPPPPPPGMTVPDPTTGTPAANEPGVAVFRRLTRTEYNNTVRDLVGDRTSPANDFPSDAESNQSGYARGGSISGVDASRLFEATEKMATETMAQRLASVLPCGQAPAAEAEQTKCAQDFIQKFGLRAFRRPLTSEETTAYAALYTQQRTEVKHDFVNAIRVVMTAFMLSPNLIYRWETATQAIKRDGKYLRFNSYELASRLSYMIYASMPDEGLFTAAAGDKLTSPDQIEQEVRRMLKDPKAKDGFGDFIHQWLVVSDLPDQRKGQQYTVYTPAVPGALLAEARDSLAAVMGDDGKLATLFTMKPSSANADVAKIYQVGGAKALRAGILTQGAFLASHAKADETHPVGRGNTIAERVLCKDLPPPPDDIPQPKDPAPNLSTRERFEDHSTNPCARSCHSIIDPLGFAFENYDAISAWRDTDGGKPVNSADQLELDGKVQKFTNGVELSALISTSKEAGDCLARQWLRYTLRRKEISGDAASLLTAREAFTKSGFDMRELLVALSRTASFTHRTASTGELLP